MISAKNILSAMNCSGISNIPIQGPTLWIMFSLRVINVHVFPPSIAL